ncbi:unnamed protein product [Penicillium salamii]|nr:unnamed protein product [Penicillium salamii]CAG8415324.1 unnamed protein product [Penicillium salamii]
MEVYFQYHRVQNAVRLQLMKLERNCKCEDYTVGSPHNTNFPSIDQNGNLEKVPYIQENDPSGLILVHWDGQDDPLNPENQTTARKLIPTSLVSLVALSVTAASAIDACGVKQYSEFFGVSEVVGSLATGLFLIGFACGSLLSGPLSETFGRNAVYIATMVLFLIFIMASALAPNLQAHLIFRFIAGLFASTPLSCAGGTVADLWNPLQKTYAFPFYAVPAFVGPMVGQIIGAYIPTTPALGWRWLEWIMLILGGAILCIIVIFLPETYGNLILRWKAKALRQQTGNDRYRSPMEMNRQSLGQRLRISISRPFAMFYSELIIILLSLYLTIMYIVLFTFLEGYTYVFGETYGISQGLTSICWAGMLVGVLLVIPLIPVVYTWTANEYKKTSAIAPETRLWYAMLGGAPALPISLFWMGWTSDSSISIWSPLIASAVFGYGITTVFIVSYMYLIDSYDIYAASALGFLVFTRYVVAGGITVAGGPIYRSIGVHYTLTILGAISAAMTPVPYLLFMYGPRIRKHSRYAVHSNTE